MENKEESLKKYVNIIKEHILNKIKDTNFAVGYNFSEFSGKKYNFNGIEISIDIKFFDENVFLIVRSQLYSVNRILLELKYNYVEEELEDTIEKIIHDVYNLKNDYVYSKTLDKIYPKKDKDLFENLYKAELFINHRIDEISECCVCYEENTVITNCNHNLCRKCHSTLTVKICPICRQFITGHIDYDYDSDF